MSRASVYLIDKEEAVRKLIEKGAGHKEIAKEFQVSVASVQWFLKKIGVATKRGGWGRRHYCIVNHDTGASWQPNHDLKKHDPLLERLKQYHG